MQEKNQQFVDLILQRVKKLLNSSSDNDLALLFGVKPGTISAWRIRNTIDYPKLIEICEERGWSLDDILLGRSTNSECISTKSNPDINMVLLHMNAELNREIGALQEQNKQLKNSTAVNPISTT